MPPLLLASRPSTAAENAITAATTAVTAVISVGMSPAVRNGMVVSGNTGKSTDANHAARGTPRNRETSLKRM